MYPDVVFYENIVKITGSFKAPMGCRSFLQGWINPETGKDEEDGRMNLGVVTVNVPRIAIESHGDKARFWKLFDERMEVAHQALQFRIMRCKEATPVNAPTVSLWCVWSSWCQRQRGPAVQERACHRVARLHRPCRDHCGLLWQELDSRPRLGSGRQGVRAVHRQAHERAVQAVEQSGGLPLFRVLHSG